MTFFISIIYNVLVAYFIFIGFNILLSWFPRANNIKFFRLTRKVSNWYLGAFHGIIIFGPFDLTPIIGLYLYQFILGLMIFK